MTDYLITYDLESGSPDPHKPFLNAAQNEGLLYVWKGSTYVNRLPNTTIWGQFSSAESANEAFNRALKAAGISVDYSITIEKRCTIFANVCVKGHTGGQPQPTPAFKDV